MKRQTLRFFTILGALMLTAMSVHAQSQRSQVTNIPFNFVVGHKTLPAGEYVVTPNRRNSDNIWLVQSRDGKVSALVSTMPVQASKTQKKTKLVFHTYGDQYFLSQIWTAGDNAGRELVMRRQERELEKNMIARRMEVLSNGTAVKD